MHQVVFEDASHVELLMRLHHIIPQWKLSEAKTASILYSMVNLSLRFVSFYMLAAGLLSCIYTIIKDRSYFHDFHSDMQRN